eukprot:CAMPEP_0196732710 /NCGR_PEP_ID=MMETSP1091-20130531/12032_1 /TAXON_ID=302021 /ORGANISM="Rhodomonas sp., Strain CCMP768" /LENGTH=395 /DNA_ID=CAMNT_0042076017 /DNA_START=563 /DNA_END=1752 /DNA_ORIENTATION=+
MSVLDSPTPALGKRIVAQEDTRASTRVQSTCAEPSESGLPSMYHSDGGDAAQVPVDPHLGREQCAVDSALKPAYGSAIQPRQSEIEGGDLSLSSVWASAATSTTQHVTHRRQFRPRQVPPHSASRRHTSYPQQPLQHAPHPATSTRPHSTPNASGDTARRVKLEPPPRPATRSCALEHRRAARQMSLVDQSSAESRERRKSTITVLPPRIATGAASDHRRRRRPQPPPRASSRVRACEPTSFQSLARQAQLLPVRHLTAAAEHLGHLRSAKLPSGCELSRRVSDRRLAKLHHRVSEVEVSYRNRFNDRVLSIAHRVTRLHHPLSVDPPDHDRQFQRTFPRHLLIFDAAGHHRSSHTLPPRLVLDSDPASVSSHTDPPGSQMQQQVKPPTLAPCLF